MANERAVILGGTGFAGRNVREALEASNIPTLILSRTTGCDLLNLPQTWSHVDMFKPTHIVNCAAIVGSVNYVTDFSADVVDLNMRMILNVYKLAQQMRETIVINPIANCAYPGVMDQYEESGFWNGPIHPSVLSYGSTRRMMWVLSKCYQEQYGVRSTNLIVPNMYGPYDSTNPNKTHALNALIMKFVRAKKQNLPEVEVWGTGKPIREWLYVKDFAAVVRSTVIGQYQGTDPINIGQNRGYSVSELVEIVRSKVNYGGKVVYNTKFGDGSPKKVMDEKLFRVRFPDIRFTSLDKGISETIAYYLGIL